MNASVSYHHTAPSALAAVQAIYGESVDALRRGLQTFVQSPEVPPHPERIRAYYPYVKLVTQSVATSHLANKSVSYGFVSGAGTFQTTLTRPDLFRHYYRTQFELLLQNHGVALEVGLSETPIPVHFSLAENDHIEGQLRAEHRQRLADVFDLPDLTSVDDVIANGDVELWGEDVQPLALFTAPRVDYSLHRLRHYTGTSPGAFQNFVLLTNYQFYIDEFIALGLSLIHI